MSETNEHAGSDRRGDVAGERKSDGIVDMAARPGEAGGAQSPSEEARGQRPPEKPGGEDVTDGAAGESHPRSEIRVPTEEDMRALGRRLAAVVRPGDLLVLTGRLGAGKTTLVQGIGEGLGVDRPVTSPTFVLARVHSSGRVPLVHADAYRLTSIAELDDLDLESPAESSVTVVEWGEGMAEDLAEDRLEVFIERGEDEERVVRLTGVGRRWQGTVVTGWS